MTYRKHPRIKWLRYDPELSGIAWKEVGKDEREALVKVVERALDDDFPGTKRALNDYAVARHRARRKAARDAEIDNRTRVLVGARLPRERAKEVKKAAALTGRSVYRFVADAIERELGICSRAE